MGVTPWEEICSSPGLGCQPPTFAGSWRMTSSTACLLTRQAVAECVAVDADFELHRHGIAKVIIDHDGGGAVGGEQLSAPRRRFSWPRS